MAPIPTPRLPLWLRALHSSARYAATASVRGLLVAEIQVFVPYRIHPSIRCCCSCCCCLLLFFLLSLLLLFLLFVLLLF